MAVHITHIMSDGSIRKSMDGFVIPVTQVTKQAYEVMLQILMQQDKNNEVKENE